MKFSNKNIEISKNAKIGLNVKIGNNTIIYDNVEIGDNSIICNDCVIGEPTLSYYTERNYINEPTIIGEGSFIRSHAIIYSGSSFGKNFTTGHRVTIRENTKFGDFCRVGTLCDIQGYVKFGDYCWLHSNVHIGQQSTIGNFVFIYPYVVFTNDPHPPSNICKGPTIGDFPHIAVGSVILSDIKIGSHCLIGAQSLVTKDVEDYSLFAGNPAKKIKDIRELKSKITEEPHYPWPYNFERSMPWEKLGYEQWLKESKIKK